MVRIATSTRTMWVKRTTVFFAVGLAVMLGVLLASTKPAHAATFTVNSTGDAGDQSLTDGRCFTGVFIQVGSGFARECTLRAAIREANATTTADTINFNIPGAGPHTISPARALPAILEPVTIDGYTEPGASVNTATTGTNAVLKIVLNGSNAPNTATGLWLTANGTVNVAGLVINGFSIGVDIGQSFPSRLLGNFIGTDATGNAAVANRKVGVNVSSYPAVIGGGLRGARNLISGNAGDGIVVAVGERHVVRGNLIGTKKDGRGALGNAGNGVWLDCSHCGVSTNTIAFNGGHAVLVPRFGSNNRILSNSIHDNGGLGIDLSGDFLSGDGVTPNDLGDPDTGGNGLQNYPVITDAVTSAFMTTISGGLNSTPNKTFTLQFFSNPPGGDEGRQFIGQQSVTTDANGNAGFTFGPEVKVPVGQTITATATRVDGSGDTSRRAGTSEFSKARVVEPPPIGGG